MPTEDHLKMMILEEIGRGERLVEQAMESKGWCWLPLYNVGRGIKQTDLTEWISKRFVFSPRGELSAFKLLKQAVEDFYHMPEDFGLYYENIVPVIQLTFMKRNLSVDLRVSGDLR